MNTKELLNDFLNLTEAAKKSAEKFLNLSYNQINWRPADSQWSIGECFEHLVRTNRKYLEEFRRKKIRTPESTDTNFRHTLIGKMILRTVMPDYKRKLRTSKAFNPMGSSISINIIQDFLKINNDLAEAAENLDPENYKTKITSPFAGYIRYNIGDSLLIIANHNMRHLRQAERVVENKKFP